MWLAYIYDTSICSNYMIFMGNTYNFLIQATDKIVPDKLYDMLLLQGDKKTQSDYHITYFTSTN